MCELEKVFHKVAQGRCSNIEVDAVPFLDQRYIFVLANNKFARLLVTFVFLELNGMFPHTF